MLVVTSCLVQCLLLAKFAEAGTFLYSQTFSLCPADSDEPWTYRGQNGPQYWGKTYPKCNGKNQSPIAINKNEATPGANLAPLALNNYDEPIINAPIRNNGHSIEVMLNNSNQNIRINESDFTLQQFHFHWGYRFNRGSEHTLDGVQYAMEMHLVHADEFKNIAVVGIFLKEGSQDNEELQNIVNELPNLRFKGNTSNLKSPLNLNKLLPENPATYYRYMGSLTTPACDEGVTWSVLPKLMPVSKKQMTEFRKLFSATKEKCNIFCGLSNNFRPIQPLNDRQLYISQ